VIGIIVVSHGNLAHELVNAARTIVGEIPAIAAVSIGWSDDMEAAQGALQKALQETGEGASLLLTDMFGGTPTNVSLPFLSDKVEIVTGVNLPMLIKATALRDGDLREIARVVREQGRSAIYVASELLEPRIP
jgi:PTS system mannose-specific IIA component